MRNLFLDFPQGPSPDLLRLPEVPVRPLPPKSGQDLRSAAPTWAGWVKGYSSSPKGVNADLSTRGYLEPKCWRRDLHYLVKASLTDGSEGGCRSDQPLSWCKMQHQDRVPMMETWGRGRACEGEVDPIFVSSKGIMWEVWGSGRMGARPLIVLQKLLDPVGDVLLRLLQLLLQPLTLCIEVAPVLIEALVQPGLLLRRGRQGS